MFSLFWKKYLCNSYESTRRKIDLSLNQKRHLKFIQFTYWNSDEIRVGLLERDNVYDLNRLCNLVPPNALQDVIKCVPVDYINQIKLHNKPTSQIWDVRMRAPLYNIDKVIGVAVNYKCYCEAHGALPPAIPAIFSKFSSTIIGHNDCIECRFEMTKKIDWEVELGVVIGKEASRVQESDAYDYIFGYTIAQDITARDWVMKYNNGQFLLGKTMDTFCPIGPYVVTPDEVGDPNNLWLRCSVNGITVQSSNTCQMLMKIPKLIARISSVMTLYPGDLILTGTPAGAGMFKQPPQFLKCKDVLISEIENIGLLQNSVTQLP